MGFGLCSGADSEALCRAVGLASRSVWREKPQITVKNGIISKQLKFTCTIIVAAMFYDARGKREATT